MNGLKAKTNEHSLWISNQSLLILLSGLSHLQFLFINNFVKNIPTYSFLS